MGLFPCPLTSETRFRVLTGLPYRIALKTAYNASQDASHPEDILVYGFTNFLSEKIREKPVRKLSEAVRKP